MELRLRPLQQPHPPLWYGTGSTHRNRWAAERSVNLLSLVPNARAREINDDYRSELAKLGRDEPFIGQARQLIVAPTDAEAEAIGERAWKRFAESFNWLVNWLGGDPYPLPPTFSAAMAAGLAFAGSPELVRQFVARSRDEAGTNYLALELAFGDITESEALQSAELFAQEVAPYF